MRESFQNIVLSVAVTNAGEYAFLLEKGIDYQFGTSPRLDSVEWSAVDDLAGGEPALASAVMSDFRYAESAIYEWMRGDGSFSAWEQAGTEANALAHLYIPPTGGVYQVRAAVASDTFSVERFFLWGDESDTYGSRKKGYLKAIGVVDEEWQKDLRNTAKAMFVIGHPASTGSGHCGIVDFDSSVIAAGAKVVHRRDDKWHDGTSGYNKTR